jgi:zinc and cadmium transporter
MSLFVWATLASLATGILSLAGGIVLLYRKRLKQSTLRCLVSFAAGAMLAAAFIDILPEAFERGDARSISAYILVGIVIFFLAEKFLLWHHHSHEHSVEETKPVGTLVILGDTMHNFLDGITIGLTFLVSVPLGIITTMAIIFHEIPQEIGDFAILLDAGFTKTRVFFYNLLSSFATLVGAWLALFFSGVFENAIPQLIALAAGSFIYISAADLIPEIHRESNTKNIRYQTLALVLGVIVIWLAVGLAE